MGELRVLKIAFICLFLTACGTSNGGSSSNNSSSSAQTQGANVSNGSAHMIGPFESIFVGASATDVLNVTNPIQLSQVYPLAYTVFVNNTWAPFAYQSNSYSQTQLYNNLGQLLNPWVVGWTTSTVQATNLVLQAMTNTSGNGFIGFPSSYEVYTNPGFVCIYCYGSGKSPATTQPNPVTGLVVLPLNSGNTMSVSEVFVAAVVMGPAATAGMYSFALQDMTVQ